MRTMNKKVKHTIRYWIHACLFVMLHAITALAQIPNNSFENWSTIGSYYKPDSWSSMNDLTVSQNVFTCVRGVPGVSGNYFLKLVSKSVTGMGTVPGIAAAGIMNLTTYQPLSGFAYNQRPQALNGSWQYMAIGSDQGYIAIEFTKWNTLTLQRDTVAFTYFPLPGMVMSWENFSIPLTYHTIDLPDSCFLVFSASLANGAAVVNSYVYLDNISFGNYTSEASNISYRDPYILVYPNPSNGSLFVKNLELIDPNAIEILDSYGRCLKKIGTTDLQKEIDVRSLMAGNYILKIISSGRIIHKQFTKE